MNHIYLNGSVGVALSQCLSELVTNLPNDPIEWIAHWLYRYRDHEHYFHEKSLFNRDLRLVKLAVQQEKNDRAENMACARMEVDNIQDDLANNHVAINNLKKALGIKTSGTKKPPAPKKTDHHRGSKHHRDDKIPSKHAFMSETRMTIMMNRMSAFYSTAREQHQHHHHKKGKRSGAHGESTVSEEASSSSESGRSTTQPPAAPPMPKMSMKMPQISDILPAKPAPPPPPPPPPPQTQMTQKQMIAQLSKGGPAQQKPRAPLKKKPTPKQPPGKPPLEIEPPFSEQNADYVARQTFPDPHHRMKGSKDALEKRHGVLDDTAEDGMGVSEEENAESRGKHGDLHEGKKKHSKTRSSEKGLDGFDETVDSKESAVDKEGTVDEEGSKKPSLITVSNLLEDAALSMGITVSDMESNFYERHPELEHMSQRASAKSSLRTSQGSSHKSSGKKTLASHSSKRSTLSHERKSTEEDYFTRDVGGSGTPETWDSQDAGGSETTRRTSKDMSKPGSKKTSGQTSQTSHDAKVTVDRQEAEAKYYTTTDESDSRGHPVDRKKIESKHRFSKEKKKSRGHSMDTEDTDTKYRASKEKKRHRGQHVDDEEAESKKDRFDSMTEDDSEAKYYLEDVHSDSSFMAEPVKASPDVKYPKGRASLKSDRSPKKSRDLGSIQPLVKATWCLDCNLGLICDHPILGQMRARCPFVLPETPEWWERKGYLAETLYDPEVYSVGFES